jgi:hypothetical protein
MVNAGFPAFFWVCQGVTRVFEEIRILFEVKRRVEGTSHKKCNDLVMPEEKNRSSRKRASLSSL